MMKYLLIALAVTAISAEFLDEAGLVDDPSLDEFLETESESEEFLPCTPKPCTPVCKLVTKYIVHGSFKLPYQENVCQPDHKCLAAAAACQKKLMAAMIDADKKAKALEAASKAKNAAHASHAAKVKAANAKKAEAAAAKNAMGLAKNSFTAAEKDAANAKAAKESATKLYAAKAKTMDARLKDYEKALQAHKNAVGAYDGAKSAAAKAASAYAAAVKVHCDAEAQHAKAVQLIGHGHHAKNSCAAADHKLCMAEAATAKQGAARRNHFEMGCNFAYKGATAAQCEAKCMAPFRTKKGCCQCNGRCHQCPCAYCTKFCKKYAR